MDRGRPSFPHDCSCRVVLEIPAAAQAPRGTGLSPAPVRHPSRFPHFVWHCWRSDRTTGRSHNPDAATTVILTRHRFGQEPVSLATTPGAILFPPATEMFQFTGCPLPSRSARRWTGGLPHSETMGSLRGCHSPILSLLPSVLHRLVVPRHPPTAHHVLPGLRVARQHASGACADSVAPDTTFAMRSGPSRSARWCLVPDLPSSQVQCVR